MTCLTHDLDNLLKCFCSGSQVVRCDRMTHVGHTLLRTLFS